MKPFSRRPEKRDQDRRRSVSLTLGMVFLALTLLPSTMVLATPQYFERAGAGVSALPLQVTAFADPKFGDVADAVNLATGNVYADLGGVNRNNTLSPTDDSKNTFGNFHVNGVQRLAGFNSLSPVQPAEWALGKGDGSFENYTRVANNSTNATCIDNRAEVVGIGKSGTGSGKVEVQVLNGANNYQSFLRQQASSMVPDGSGAYRMADWDKDGLPDLVKIKRGTTASGKTELTILSAASNYQTAVVQSATVLGQTDGNWDFQMADFNGDGTLDLIAMPRNNTGSGTIEAHIMNGADNFQSFLLQTRTGFPQADGASLTHHWADVDGDGKLDMIGVFTGSTASGRVEVQVASGASGYQTLGPRIVTPWSTSTSNWVYNFSIVDWNKDGKPDLMGVSKDPSGSSAIAAVHVLDGNTNFQTALLDTTTPLSYGATDFILRGNDYAQNCSAQSYNLATAPSWINERYASMQGQVSFYVSKPQATTQVDESWLVTYRLPSGRTVAQVYDHDGNRTTFYANGEYADSTQTLSQQYRSAKYKGDADGLGSDSPKTAFSYTGLNNGHLAKVRDEWGRSTVYIWDETTGTLGAVRMLLQDENNTDSWVRDVEYAYGVVGGQRVVTYMGFRTLDGQKQWIGRWLALNYVVGANGAVLLSGITRSAIAYSYDGSIPTPITTTYGYDGQNRVNLISELGLPDTSIAYSADGLTVTRTQGAGLYLPAKIETLTYAAGGWLRSRQLRVSNNIDEEYQRLTDYWYDAAGHVVASTRPGGSQTQYTYDGHGNRVSETLYAAGQAWSDPAPAGYVRKTTTSYDNDNQVTNITDEARSGKVDGDAAYAYGKVTRPQPRGYYSQTAGSQVFRSLSQHNDDRAVNDVWVGATNDFYDEQGRLTTHKTFAAGQTTKVTTYAYKDGSASERVVYGGADGNWLSSEMVRSYGDQVAAINVDGAYKSFAYNQYGDLVYIIEPEAFVGKWNGGTPSTRLRETIRTFNGFGQQTFDHVLTQDGAGTAASYNWNESKKYWQYYSTGELDSSWEGSPSNVTDYRYYGANDGGNAGRLAAVVKGSGGGGGVATPHSTTTLTYDLYGRVNASNTDGFTTSTAYDTLDRPVKVIKPDGSSKMTYYDVTGGVRQTRLTDTTGRLDGTTATYDALGRVTLVTYTDDRTVSTFYDPFDRPIKVTDSRLTMNATWSDRSTYLVYDDLGNLIKKLSPALVTAGQQYTDARRPYSEYSYDNFGRQTSVSTLLYGKAVAPTSMSLDGGTVATTRVGYDAFDRPTKVTDPSGYTTDTTYDNSGNAVKVIRQAWTGSEPDYSVAAPSVNTVTTYAAYDGMGHPVQSVDARGNVRKAYYDVLGNPTMQVDARNVVTKLNWYTADGLLDSVWEPKLDGTAAPTDGSFVYSNGGGASGFGGSMVATEHYLYGTRVYPTTVERAVMNSSAYGSANSTGYAYDYSGRPTSITLPKDQNGATATLSKSYDSQGNVLSETDASGFPTSYGYDWAGHLRSKNEQARSGNATDSNAGLGSGLQSSYNYDGAGNLTSKVERGLTTSYQYNSLGKVIGESRPHTSAVGDLYWKLSTYRLDGLKTAQTTYDYSGTLSSKPEVVVAGDASIGVNSGNVTLMEYNARGDQWAELSYATGHNNESAWWQYVNGLGQRYKRVFTGSTGIYAEQRTALGAKLGHANYLTYWRSDQSGNLIEKWDTPMDGGNWQPRDASDRQNTYSYTYSPTNKELTQSRNVQVRVQNAFSANTLWSQGGSNGVLLAANIGSTTTGYNPRDQIIQVSTTDQAPVIGTGSTKQSGYGNATTKNTTFAYYADGREYQSTTDKGSRTTTYDNRGRDISISVPDVTTSITRNSDGSENSSVVLNSPTITYYSNTRVPTTGGLTAVNTISKSDGTPTSVSNTVYNSDGKVVRLSISKGTTTNQSSSYNEYGQLLTATLDGTTVYSGTYNTAGHLTAETKPDPNLFNYSTGSYSNNSAPTAYSYTLDSRGNRLAVSGGAYNGGSKRYNAEDQTSQFFFPNPANICGTWIGCDGSALKYNDFRYDPNGQQVLSSVAGIAEGQTRNEYYISRDQNSAVKVERQHLYTFRRGGGYDHMWSPYGCGGTACYDDDPASSSYSPDYGLNALLQKDSTYSLAIGYRDDTAWTGVAPFALPRRGVKTLQAPVTPLSSKLRVNPASVTSTGVTTRLPDPSKVVDGSKSTASAPETLPLPVGSSGTDGTIAIGAGASGVGTTVQAIPTNTVNPQSAVSSGATSATPRIDPAKVVSTPAVSDLPRTGDPSKPDETKAILGFAAEVEPNFDDGTGFKHPIYAQNVRPMGIMMLDPGDGGSLNTDLGSSSTHTDNNKAMAVGDVNMQEGGGLNGAQHQAETASKPPSSSRSPAIQEYGDEVAASPDISAEGKTTALKNAGATYVPPADDTSPSSDSKGHGRAILTQPMFSVRGAVELSDGSYLLYASNTYSTNPYSKLENLGGRGSYKSPQAPVAINDALFKNFTPTGLSSEFRTGNFLRPSTPSNFGNQGGNISYPKLMDSIPKGIKNEFDVSKEIPSGFKYTFTENNYTYRIHGHTSDATSPGYSRTNPTVTIIRSHTNSDGAIVKETLLPNNTWNNPSLRNSVSARDQKSLMHIPLGW